MRRGRPSLLAPEDASGRLEKPPEDWEGETGLVAGELLDRQLPKEDFERMIFICGPEPMMVGAITTLRGFSGEWTRFHPETGDIHDAGDPPPLLLEAADWQVYVRLMRQLDPGFERRLILYREQSDWINRGCPTPVD